MDLAETDRLASCCLMMMTSRRRRRERVYLPEISLVLVYVTYENTRGGGRYGRKTREVGEYGRKS